MFTISKRIEVAGAHRLHLPYKSKCRKLHGHNWIVNVEISGKYVNEVGMLLDFTHIKDIVNMLDHDDLNQILPDNLNPTAENIAKWIAIKIDLKIQEEVEKSGSWDTIVFNRAVDIPRVTKVSIQESEGNVACYIR